MRGQKTMSYTESWLHELPLFKTKKGARLDLRFYIYPDGHGNVHYKAADTGKDMNQPVNDVDEALAVLRAIWERAEKLGVQAMPPALDEP